MTLQAPHERPLGPLQGLRGSFLALAFALAQGTASCGGEPDLIVYCALDQVFAEPLIARFEAETGLDVRAEFDIEASKTVGLVARLIEERGHTRCDVFWNNEIAHTVRLAEMGLLAAYDSPSASEIPAEFRDRERRWTGFAARARVFIVNTDLVTAEQRAELDNLEDLLDPQWLGRAGLARPLTGTTLTHATALFDQLGEVAATEFMRRLAAAGSTGDLNLATSNGQVMRLVSSGELAFGLTDTDDFNVARLKGAPVEAIFPGQDEDGTLLIPNTVAILKAAPHPGAAERFVDWALSVEIERELAFSDSAQIPVRAAVERPPHVASLEDFKRLPVSYVSIGKQIANRTRQLAEIFLR